MKAKEFFVKRHSIFYGAICLLANLLAVILTSLLASFTPDTTFTDGWEYFSEWIEFLCEQS